MKNKLFISLLLFSSFFTSPSFSMNSTELEIRAQDDETLGGLKLKLRITERVNDGPTSKNIEVITEGNQRAIVDNDGNFLRYEVDSNGNIAPRLILNSFQRSGRFPKANVTLTKGGKEANKALDIKGDTDELSYIIIDENFTSADFLTNIISQPSRNPNPLGVVDKDGNLLFKKTVDEMPFFDAVSIFGTVWSIFDMYEKDLAAIGNQEAIRKFSTFRNRQKLRIFPHMNARQFAELYPGEKYEKYERNAFYDYRQGDSQGEHVLAFFPVSLNSNQPQYTSQSFDIGAHETGHASLNILRPDLWQSRNHEIGAFHESYGDMTTLFTVLRFPELRKKVLEKTNGNLHLSSFLSVIGEKIVDRDASQCTTLSILPSCEEHDLSERLTRALYGTLADVFNIIRNGKNNSELDALLENTVSQLRRSFLKTTVGTTFQTFTEFGKVMRDTNDPLWSNFLHANFLRQGIDLTGLVNSPQVCVLSKEGGAGPTRLVKCSTNQRKNIWGRNDDSEDLTELNFEDSTEGGLSSLGISDYFVSSPSDRKYPNKGIW